MIHNKIVPKEKTHEVHLTNLDARRALCEFVRNHLNINIPYGDNFLNVDWFVDTAGKQAAVISWKEELTKEDF